MREKQIIGLLKEGKSQAEMLSLVYPNLDERLLPYADKTLLCHLEKIRKEKLA